ncbi:hypothetical protein [Aeromicrobium erythreum]|uniref:Gram-positive cocci surface proteins LPxTG domain-containing protein n=1 Tax=Aeromicrobium erythreum TaxID=2041 RepID=A0A0U3SY15_9ACTN|nr:hypothetical protein [Aeromicrobium erythreum]ALX03434.1 hypothetical protein AERYTH_01320 [Aeromicrobium erythreum]
MTRRLLAALVATLLGVATGAVVVQAPAQAAACAQGDGVTVVVDPHQLGGGVSTTCVPGSGSKASAAFTAAGVSMQRAARERGFVCRVNALPVDAGCVQASPADAYWSLWVSTGNGSWSYAQIGVDGLDVPRGGWVAWSWQGQASRAQPGVSPVGAAAVQPSARPTGSTGGSRGPSSSEGRGGSGASGDGGATAGTPSSGRATGSSKDAEQKSRDGAKDAGDDEDEKRARNDERARRTAPSATPSSSDAASAGSGDETRATSAHAGSGAPVGTLVAVGVVLALLGAAGVVARRRRDDRS